MTKRNIYLQPLSREHHHGLLLCWKIRTGIKKNIEPERIKVYTKWFWDNHLKPHFQAEEDYVFPILGKEHELIKQALSEHQKIKSIFEFNDQILKSLSLIADELEAHIRFEERTLFNAIEEVATNEQLKLIEQHHHSDQKFVDNLTDPFWE